MFAIPTLAQETRPIDATPISEEEALRRDATEYAKTFDVELEEAIKRLTLQTEIGALNYSLTTLEPERFGGLYIQHTPKYQVVVLLTDTDKDILSPHLSDSALADVVEVRAANLSLMALRNEQETAMKIIKEIDIPVDSALLVDKGVVELYVVQRKEFDEALQKSSIELPSHVEVVTVEQLAEPATNIYGGLHWDNITCTTGFAVQHFSRTLGVSTAGHCGNEPPTPELNFRYAGTVLPHVETAYSGSADVQWHTTPGFSVRNWIYDGSNVREITATKHHVLQFPGQWVCHYGRSTGAGCGNITSIDFSPSDYVPNASATYVTVYNPAADLATPGDSGGPWFSGNTALGIHSGWMGDAATSIAIYMPINYIDALSVNVYTGKETYLPDVRNSNGWSSNITIRYTGSFGRSVTTVYLDNNGNYVPASKDECFLGQNQSCTVTPPANFEGSAVIDGSDDLSVVVYTDGAARGSLDNGFAPQLGGVGDATFEQAGTVLYAPAFYKNSWGINSSVSIVNVGSVPTNVNVEFIGRTTTDGNFVHNISSIPAGGRVTVNGGHIQNGGAPWVGSLRLTSTGVGSSPAQPIVAMVNDDTTANPVYSRSYNATKFGSPLVYVPAAYRTLWGFNTGLVVQNLGTSTTNVTLTFCPRLVGDPTQCPTTTINNLEPLKAQGVLLSNLPVSLFQGQTGWTGSVKLQTTTSGVPIAVAVTNSNGVGGYNYSATGRGGRTVYLPYAARNANGISTGYTVRNVSTSSDPITVQANFYNTSGTLRHTYSFDLGPAQVKGFAQILDGTFTQHESWQGSIVLQSTGDIVAMMRADDGDAVSAYNGIVR